MSSRADALVVSGDPGVVRSLGALLVAVVAAISDPASELGAPATRDVFLDEARACAAGLGLDVGGVMAAPHGAARDAAGPAGATGLAASTPATEYVRLFVNGRRGPASPPWASYYTEGRLAGDAALRAVPVDEASLHAAVALEEADGAAAELAALAVLLLEQRLDEARTCVADHLDPWMASFATRLAAEARLPQHRFAAAALLELFGSEIREAVMSA